MISSSSKKVLSLFLSLVLVYCETHCIKVCLIYFEHGNNVRRMVNLHREYLSWVCILYIRLKNARGIISVFKINYETSLSCNHGMTVKLTSTHQEYMSVIISLTTSTQVNTLCTVSVDDEQNFCLAVVMENL